MAETVMWILWIAPTLNAARRNLGRQHGYIRGRYPANFLKE
jgi:hypothetical protein